MGMGEKTSELRVAFDHLPILEAQIDPRRGHRNVSEVGFAMRGDKAFQGFCRRDDRHSYPWAHVKDVAPNGRHTHARLDRGAVEVWFPLLGAR